MKNRWIPFGLILAGLILIFGSSAYSLYRARLANPDSAPLPQQLAGLPRTRVSTGDRAIVEVSRLHGKSFPLTSGAVGVYGEQQQTTIWVSGTLFPWMGSQMVSAMYERIGEGDSPFTPLETIPSGRRNVYALDGMGQRHYYFQSGALVVWVSAAPELAQQALQESLDFYP